MPEHKSSMSPEEIKTLLDIYENQRDFGQKSMKKQYPHIDFNKPREDILAEHIGTTASDEGFSHYSPPQESKKVYHESVWVNGLRIFAQINLVSGVIGGFVAANYVGAMFADWGQNMNWELFFVILVYCLFATFLTTAVIMVFLDMATDISITKQSNSDILKTLNKMVSNAKEK